MENASKALLIAGAILIAIALIAIGIRILSTINGVTNNVDEVSETMGVSVFNSQFTKYADETQSSAKIQTLINIAVATYREGSSHKVSVVFVPKTGSSSTCSDANSIAGIISKLQVTKTYKVTTYVDSAGYINKIQIKEQ